MCSNNSLNITYDKLCRYLPKSFCPHSLPPILRNRIRDVPIRILNKLIAHFNIFRPTKPQNSQWILVLLTRNRLLSQLRIKSTFSILFSPMLRIVRKRVYSSTTINVFSPCLISSFKKFSRSSFSKKSN